ncbi:hypothetical protein [Aquimarina pacifica]|uniref:hypothetical protein n=1 Tax=Aquimarina pacifica TaxID=1296415 RepID=UPI0004720A47|nr:hypothetical protein [Aquimarina pacifica]
MNTISSIIHTLSNEEKRSFVVFLKKKNKRNDTKNIQLFKLLDTYTPIKNPDILIYGKKSKGAYHALCKRLHDTLIDFIASKSFEGETSEEFDILKLLIASRIFFEQKQYKIAFKTIRKAEKKAIDYSLFSILHEIYYTQIQYAHLNTSISLKVLLKTFEKNKKALQQEENLNLFYATIQNELLQQETEILPIIENSLSKYNILKAEDLSFRSLFRILEISTKTAQLMRNYNAILPFIEGTYRKIDAHDKTISKHLFYHIQILYFVANSYFRNRDFNTSQQYLSLMLVQMKAQKNRYFKRFFAQYTLLLAFNLNYTGQAKSAINLLETFDYKKYSEHTSYLLDLKLSLLVYYFQQQYFKAALNIINDLYHSDQWYTQKAGIVWVIKKNLIEILLHIELDHLDLVDSRVTSFRKKHTPYLKKNNETRTLEFLKLVVTYYNNPKIVHSTEFTDSIKKSLKNSHATNESVKPEEDIFEMSFYAWIKSKVEGTPLYNTTLELMR